MVETQNPIFIIGPPRSGTTLLATMLNAHPRMFIAHETKVFVQLLSVASSGNGSLSLKGAERFSRQLERHYLGDYVPLPGPDILFDGADRLTTAAYLHRLFGALADREGKARWGEKTAVGYRRLDELRVAYQSAQFLGLQRDPAAVALSYRNVVPKWGETGGLVHWLEFHEAVARQGPGLEILLVPYTALVSDSERTLRGVCEFLGEGFDDAMLTHHRTKRARDLAGTAEYGGVTHPVYLNARTPVEQLGPWLRIVVPRVRAREAALRAGYTRRPFWERALRVVAFARASVWQAVHVGSLKHLLARVFRRLRLNRDITG